MVKDFPLKNHICFVITGNEKGFTLDGCGLGHKLWKWDLCVVILRGLNTTAPQNMWTKCMLSASSTTFSIFAFSTKQCYFNHYFSYFFWLTRASNEHLLIKLFFNFSTMRAHFHDKMWKNGTFYWKPQKKSTSNLVKKKLYQNSEVHSPPIQLIIHIEIFKCHFCIHFTTGQTSL